MANKSTLIKITLGVVGLVLILSIFSGVSPDLYEIQKEYKDTYTSADGAYPPNNVGYRIGLFSVTYYENCSDPFNTWCKNKLNGVKPSDFVPLNRYTSKVVNKDGSGAVIYYTDKPIPDSIVANSLKFRALSKLNTNPVYFTDDEYIYYLESHCCAERYSWISTDNKSDIVFPIKIEPGDVYEVPERLENKFEFPVTLKERVLFLNDNVYVNGKLIPSANSSTYKQKVYDEELGTYIISD